MSNDPKDAVVDVAKLMRSQTSTPPSTPIIPVSATSNMITNCNESANMIGHENFSQNDGTQKKKPD